MAQQKREHNTKYYPDRISNKQTQKPYESAISIWAKNSESIDMHQECLE